MPDSPSTIPTTTQPIGLRFVTATSTIAIADRARAERDHFVAQDQRLLLVHELVADEEREVQQQSARDEVREDEQRQRREGFGREPRPPAEIDTEPQAYAPNAAMSATTSRPALIQAMTVAAAQDGHVREQDADVHRQRRGRRTEDQRAGHDRQRRAD